MWRLSSTSPPSGARGSAASSLAAAFALALLTPSAAVAAPTSDALEISVDGVEFAASFAGSLFVEAPTLVPHGGADVTFSVRNAAESGGVLSLELRHATWTDLEFARALRVQATAGSVAGGSPRLSSGASCVALVTGVPLRAGATLPIRLELRLGDLEGLAGQEASAQFNLAVTLTGDARAEPACAGTPDLVIPVVPSDAGGEPSTTAGVTDTIEASSGGRTVPEGRLQPWDTVGLNTVTDWFAQFVVMAGGTLAGVLLWIVIRRRRRRESEETPS